MITAKRQGRQCTVYIDNGVPVTISSFTDEPPAFPFTARQEEIEARFGRNIKYFDMPDTAAVSGVAVSDEQILRAVPDSQKEMGVHRPHRPGYEAPTPAPAQAAPTNQTIALNSALDLQDKALNRFREMVRMLGFAKGRDRKAVAADIEAVGSFLISISPQIEPILKQITEEESSGGRTQKRFSI